MTVWVVLVEDSRHKIILFMWENGKVIVENATHANLAAMAGILARKANRRRNLC